MNSISREKITLLDRVLTSVFSVIAMFLTCLFISYVIVRWTPFVREWDFLINDNVLDTWANASWLWSITDSISVLAGFAGFILGASKMIDVFGSIWGTNKP